MKDDNCLFCKIIAGDIPSSKVYEDENVFAFRDINPQAPVHILVVPKEHIACANDIDSTNSAIVAHVFESIAKIARAEGLDKAKKRLELQPDLQSLFMRYMKKIFNPCP